MTLAPRRKVALRKLASFTSFAAFAAVVVGSLSLVGPVRPAFADDQSRAVSACRTSVAERVEGVTSSGLGLDRIGGGGRRYKVWLAAAPSENGPARQFLCIVKRSGAVEEVTAVNADGSPGQNLLAAR